MTVRNIYLWTGAQWEFVGYLGNGDPYSPPPTPAFLLLYGDLALFNRDRPLLAGGE